MKTSNEKLKIFYITSVRIPTEKAHGIQIMKMCEAFAIAGAEVTLVLPRRRNSIKQDPFTYYGVEPIFEIKKLPTLDLLFINIPLTFLITTVFFSIAVFFYLLFKKKNYVVYTRGEIILSLAKFIDKRLFWETHIKPSNVNLYKKAIKNINGLIVVTRYYKDLLLREFSVPLDRVYYSPDGVDLGAFDIDISKEGARKKLGIPTDKKIVVYTGSLLKWKGVEDLVESARFLDNDNLIYVVGELKKDKEYYAPPSDLPSNINFVGLRPYKEIPLWLKASDALMLTGTNKNEMSKYYTSPLKLFEYMTSGRPIIAPEIPSFSDVLNKENSFLVKPDDARSLGSKIRFVLENKEKADLIAKRAYSDSKKYSWEERAENIIEFMKMNISDL